jgi:hypothetical protein
MMILIIMTIDQDVISTVQLERPADEVLSADRETAVDETAEHSWRSRSFSVVAPAPALSLLHEATLRRYKFVIFGDACRTSFCRAIGCQHAASSSSLLVDAASWGASDYADEVRYAQDVGSRMRTSR